MLALVAGLAPLLGYLADLGVAPDLVVVPVAVVTAAERLVEDYREYLLSERGLAASTVRYCTEVAESSSLASRARPANSTSAASTRPGSASSCWPSAAPAVSVRPRSP